MPHAGCLRVCAPFELRRTRMMKRLDTGDHERIEDEMLAFVEVAAAVPGVRDVAYRTNPGDEVRPRYH